MERFLRLLISVIALSLLFHNIYMKADCQDELIKSPAFVSCGSVYISEKGVPEIDCLIGVPGASEFTKKCSENNFQGIVYFLITTNRRHIHRVERDFKIFMVDNGIEKHFGKLSIEDGEEIWEIK